MTIFEVFPIQLAIWAVLVKRLDRDSVNNYPSFYLDPRLCSDPIGIINFFNDSLKRLGFGFTPVNPIW